MIFEIYKGKKCTCDSMYDKSLIRHLKRILHCMHMYFLFAISIFFIHGEKNTLQQFYCVSFREEVELYHYTMW